MRQKLQHKWSTLSLAKSIYFGLETSLYISLIQQRLVAWAFGRINEDILIPTMVFLGHRSLTKATEDYLGKMIIDQ